MGLYNPNDEESQLNAVEMTSPIAPAFPKAPPEAEDTSLSFGEDMRLVKRSMEQNNPVISLIHNGIGDWTKSDPNFSAWKYIEGTKYAAHPEIFANTDNAEELFAGMKQADEIDDYNNLASRAPTLAFWSAMGSAAIDPLLAVPGYGTYKAVKVGKIVSTARTAALAGGLGAGGVGLQEAVLQAGNPERTATESAINIAAGGIVGALFGGAVAKFTTPDVQAVDQGLANLIPERSPDTMQKFDTMPAKVDGELTPREQAMAAVKGILSIGDDSIPPPDTAYLASRMDTTNYESLDKMTRRFEDDIDDVELNNPIKPEDATGVTDQELADALAPTQPYDPKALEKDTQGIGADHMTFDARVAGIPQFAMKAVASLGQFVNPSIEGLADNSAILRSYTTRLGYIHTALEDSAGKQITAPISFESNMQQDLKLALDFNDFNNQAYMRYLQIDPDSMTASAQMVLKSKGKGVLSRSDFEEAVMDAHNAGDRHAIPEVENAAKYGRALMDERWDTMQSIGVIPKEAQKFPSFFKVVYDIPYVIEHRTQMEAALTKMYMNKRHAVVSFERDGKLYTERATYHVDTKQHDWVAGEGEVFKDIKVEGNLSLDEAREAAADSVDNILQMGDKSLMLGDLDRLSFSRGTNSMKPRRIVTDERSYQEVKEFMVKDYNKIMHMYLASTSRAINYKKLLDSMGFEKIQDGRLAIKNEYAAKRIKIQNMKDMPEKKRDGLLKKLTLQEQKSQELFQDLTKIALGQIKERKQGDAFWRTLNQYNVMRMYGGILLSSIADPAATLIKNSIPRAIWHGWLSEVKQLVSGTRNMKKQDYRNALTAIQTELDDITRYMTNPDLGIYGTGPKERLAQMGGNFMMRAQGMTAWNMFWQKSSHNLAEHNILRHTAKITQKGMKYLKEIGIDEDMAGRIVAMQKKYGQDIKGTHISNSHLWKDRDAANAFNNAIRVEVHKSPLMTEMLDIPRFFQRSEFRKSMVLGKGFSFGALTKLSMSMASRHDGFAAQGFIILAIGGMVQQLLKDRMAGRDSNYTIDEWIRKGLDRSGALGILADPMFKAADAIDAQRKFGGNAWMTEPLDYIMGPTSSMINPAYRGIMTSLGGNPLDKKTETQLKGLIPGRNLWWLQQVLGNNGKNK